MKARTVEMPKCSDADKDHFRSAMPDDPRVEVKPMFGALGAFVNGNMFAGLFGSDIGVKLPEDAAAELLAVDGSGPFGPAERPMGGYVSVPAAWRDQPAKTDVWVDRSLAYVSEFAPKVKKARAPRKTKKAEK